MKIKFLAHYPPSGEINNHYRWRFSVNLAYFYLKHFYDLYGRNANVQWQLADFFVLDDFEIIVSRIEQNLPDILCLSVFIWNETLQHHIAKTIKQKHPKICVIMGGPQLTAHKDTAYFDLHPYVDYVVYGDGERAFQQIIDHRSGIASDKTEWVNIVENTAGQCRVYPFEQLTDETYFSSSAILSQQDFVIEHIRDLEARGVPRREMIFAVEFARGCMYNCSFCDWSQNLTKKVKRRKIQWQKEIDFWHQQDVALRETDANFGQWDEDIEIFRYAMSLYDPARNFRFMITNTPKIKKKNTYELLKTSAEKLGMLMKISLQDINEAVLQKMERPSLSWEDHKTMIQQLRDNLDSRFHHLLLAELMVGVAGQTYDSVCDTVRRIIYEAGIQQFFMNHWMFLPNSPAADPFYQRMHGLKWIKGYTVDKNNSIGNVDSLENIYKDIATGHGYVPNAKEGTYIFSTDTMNFADMMAVHILQTALINAGSKFGTLQNMSNFEKFFDAIKQKSLKSALRQFDEIRPLIDKYGMVIMGSFLPNQKAISHRWLIID